MGCKELDITDYYRFTDGNKKPLSGPENPYQKKAVYAVFYTVISNYRYYSPELGRWTKRDPIKEVGFKLLRTENHEFNLNKFKRSILKLATSVGNNTLNNNPCSSKVHRTNKTPLIKNRKSKIQDTLYGFVSNQPLVLLDNLGLTASGCSCGEAYSVICKLGYEKAEKAKELADAASKKAAKSGLPGAVDGLQDAYRHCLWACTMTKELGLARAEWVLDNHEKCNPNKNKKAAQMDKDNNTIGMAYGILDMDCEDSCYNDAISTPPGLVVVVPPPPTFLP